MHTTDERASASTTGMIVAVALMVVMSGVVYAGLSTRMDEQTDAETTIERASVDIVSQDQLRVVPMIGSSLDLDSITVRVTFPNSEKRGFTVTDAGQAIEHSRTTTETTTRTVTNGVEPEPVYKTVTRPVYETVEKRVQTGTETVGRTVPTYRWNRTVTEERPIHRWNRTVTEQIPQYRWRHEWTEQIPRYQWERTVTDRDTTVSWESPGTEWSKASGVLYTDTVYKGRTRERVQTGYKTKRRFDGFERERVRTGYETHEECSTARTSWGIARGRTCETVREPVYGYERVPVYETVRQPTYEWQWTADYDTERYYRYERLDRTTDRTLSATEPAGDGWRKASQRVFAYKTVERTETEVATTRPGPDWRPQTGPPVSYTEQTRTETTLSHESPGDEWHRVSDTPVRTDTVELTQTQTAPRQPGEDWSPVSGEPVGETTVTTQRSTYGIVEQRIRTGTTTDRVISHYRMVPKTTIVTETETTATFDDSVASVERGFTDDPAHGAPDHASIVAADTSPEDQADERDDVPTERDGESEETDRNENGASGSPPARVLERLPFLASDATDDPPARATHIVKGVTGTTTRDSPTVWQNGESLTVHLRENHISEGDIVRVEIIDTDAESVVLDKQVRATNLPSVSLDSTRAGDTSSADPSGTGPPSSSDSTRDSFSPSTDELPATSTPSTPGLDSGTGPATDGTSRTPSAQSPSRGTRTDASQSGSMADTDRQPAVSISGPNTVLPGSEATFDANVVDDNGIVDYSWSGAYSYDQSTATHTFADAPGERRRISVTVTDTAGQTATATKVVEISERNRDPQIEVTPGVTGCVGDTVQLNPTIVTEDGDTATGEWSREMPIRLESPGVSSVTYTATDNHGAKTYKSVRITTMSCDSGDDGTSEIQPADIQPEGNEVVVLSGEGEMTIQIGDNQHERYSQDTVAMREMPESGDASASYLGAGIMAAADKAKDTVAPDSYTIKMEMSRSEARSAISEAKQATDQGFGKGSQIALNKHKSLRNGKIEDGLDSDTGDTVTVIIKVGPHDDIDGQEIAEENGEIQETQSGSELGSSDEPSTGTTDSTTTAQKGVSEAVASGQTRQTDYTARRGTVMAVREDQQASHGNSDQSLGDSSSETQSSQGGSTSSTDENTSAEEGSDGLSDSSPMIGYGEHLIEAGDPTEETE